jgi:exodeoxyribonuclease VII large subunit
VVTSATGAAIRDILNVISERYPLAEVVISPSKVQGIDAPASLVEALERLNGLEDIDVVIIGRGGGSVEDLWAFNDEAVARAVVASRAPVISGVGHETDFCITDFVADLRAATPTAAAAAAVPDARELHGQVRLSMGRLTDLVEAKLRGRQDALEQQERLVRLHDPGREIAEHRQRVDEMVYRVGESVRHQLVIRGAGLDRCRKTLNALGPQRVLERGYAIVRDRVVGEVIHSIRQATVGVSLEIQVADGRIGARATDIAGGG